MPSASSVPPSSPRSVLVVEDDENTRALTSFILRTAYDVTCVPGSAEAMEAARRTYFDALVLDINLGRGGCGTDLLRALRATPRYRRVPAVAVTAYAMPGDRGALLGAGFDAYQSKPFTKRQILGVVKQVLAPVAA